MLQCERFPRDSREAGMNQTNGKRVLLISNSTLYGNGYLDHAELGEVIAGVKAGRTSSDEIIIFDSTGMALQDVITATIIYENAVKNSIGTVMEFAA